MVARQIGGAAFRDDESHSRFSSERGNCPVSDKNRVVTVMSRLSDVNILGFIIYLYNKRILNNILPVYSKVLFY